MCQSEITSLFDFFEQIPDEQAAIDYFRSIRWANDEAFCPHCGSTTIYHFKDNRTHKCGKCRKRFSIKVGTIFQDSKIPLRKWLAAIWLVTSHKKGIASTQLAKDIKVTQKTAWFMLHRLRHAARSKSFNAPLKGTVEIDETFVGGKDRNRHKRKRQGREWPKKITKVFGVLERGGQVRAVTVSRLDSSSVYSFMRQNVETGTVVMSDSAAPFIVLRRDYPHGVVDHSKGEYVHPRDPSVHTNTIEGFWSLFKRQVNGTHHWISKKHTNRYLDEMCYRYARRDMREGQRIADYLGHVSGRLTYKALIA